MTAIPALAELRPTRPLPPATGIGLKPQHFADVLDQEDGRGGDTPVPGWAEIHPQNYFVAGGPMLRWLEATAERMPVSYHSTGLSLGSADGLDTRELERLADLVERIAPSSISDHLSWSNDAHEHFCDLLPMPYTHEALDRMSASVDAVQDRLGRPMLVENPSRYLAFAEDDYDEVEFLHRLCERTGCGLLFDINNVVVSATNLGLDAARIVASVDPALVGEVHLAGHAREDHGDFVMAIDDHGSAVSDETWALYDAFIAHSGPLPTLIEWDTDTPDYPALMAEAVRADAILANHRPESADALAA
jgi:hypothetical protein